MNFTKVILCGLMASSLVGCAYNQPKDSGKIDVNVTATKVELSEISSELLNKCEKPQKISETVPGIKSGKVLEKDVIAALVRSYTNEVNCYLVKEEALRVQSKMRDEVNKANGNVN
jgi:hypothetical protein